MSRVVNSTVLESVAKFISFFIANLRKEMPQPRFQGLWSSRPLKREEGGKMKDLWNKVGKAVTSWCKLRNFFMINDNQSLSSK